MHFLRLAATATLVSAALIPCASATPIALFSGQVVTSASRAQTGKLADSKTPQTWSGAEAFPGVDPSSTGTSYYYNTYTLNYANFYPNGYVEVTFTDITNSGHLFLSAYAGTYDPTQKQLNWLGDIGSPNSETFDVYLPFRSNLVLVANTTGTAGLGDPFNIFVSAYTDTNRDDAPVTGQVPLTLTPEPSSFALLGTGLLGAFGVARKRFV